MKLIYVSGTYWPIETSACQYTLGEYERSHI